jgi:hypothetical protein
MLVIVVLGILTVWDFITQSFASNDLFTALFDSNTDFVFQIKSSMSAQIMIEMCLRGLVCSFMGLGFLVMKQNNAEGAFNRINLLPSFLIFFVLPIFRLLFEHFYSFETSLKDKLFEDICSDMLPGS